MSPGQQQYHLEDGASQMAAIEAAHLQLDVGVQEADRPCTNQKPSHIVKLKIKHNSTIQVPQNLTEQLAPAPAAAKHSAVLKVKVKMTVSTSHASSGDSSAKPAVGGKALSAGSSKRARTLSSAVTQAQGIQERGTQETAAKRPRLNAQLDAGSHVSYDLVHSAEQVPVLQQSAAQPPATHQQPVTGTASAPTAPEQSAMQTTPPPTPSTASQLTETQQRLLARARKIQSSPTLKTLYSIKKRPGKALLERKSSASGKDCVAQAQRKVWATRDIKVVSKLPYLQRKDILQCFHSHLLPAGCKRAWQPTMFGLTAAISKARCEAAGIAWRPWACTGGATSNTTVVR